MKKSTQIVTAIYSIFIIEIESMKNKKKTTTEIICENLGLPNQTIFQDYKCTLKVGLPFFGRLYIGQEHLMFVSNMFGIVKKAAIIIDTITKVTQIQSDTISITGKQFKNIKKEEEQFIFTGFKNSNAFKIIYALWKKQKLSSDVLNCRNEQESESGQKMSDNKNLDEANMEMNFFNPQIVDTEKQKMVELVLPCSLEQFYNFFIADEAEIYPRKKHLQFKKAINITVTPWKRNEEMKAEMRQITATLKVKGVPFKSEAGMNQIWLLTKRTQEEITIKTITQMADVPFSSYFTCEEHIVIQKQGETKCKFSCCSAIVFNKSTYMKNTILTRTFADLKEDYMQWSQNVKDLLEKMKKNRQEAQKRKSKPAFDVEFESQKMLSPTRSNQSIIKGEAMEVNCQLAKKIDSLNKKITQLIIVVLVLSLLVVGNFFICLYLINSDKESNPLTNSQL